MDKMTALVSAFARAYHYINNDAWVFADPYAEKMLTDEENASISQNMSQGISFFAPEFRGTPEEALRYIVDHQLAPSVLARCAFCERAIDNAVKIGCGQVVLYACGYDTFSLRNQRKGLKIYELDKPEMICDKQCRIKQVGLQPSGQIEYISCDLSLSSWREELINRDFDSGNVPARSAFGNRITSALFRLGTGVSCSDTQTGLRGIPPQLVPLAQRVKGDRFDYEMNFLAEAVRVAPLITIPIETVYEKGNAGSHFRPVRDSLLIYREPIKKLAAGLSAAGLAAAAAGILHRYTRE